MNTIYINLSYNEKYNLWHYSYEEQRFSAIGYKFIVKNIDLNTADIFSCYIDEKYKGENVTIELIKQEYKGFKAWCNYVKKQYVC
jgi:hypothetical protein